MKIKGIFLYLFLASKVSPPKAIPHAVRRINGNLAEDTNCLVSVEREAAQDSTHLFPESLSGNLIQ